MYPAIVTAAMTFVDSLQKGLQERLFCSTLRGSYAHERGAEMVYAVMSHKVAHRFEVEIERDDENVERRRYQAHCKGLSGCTVYASSKAEALRKIRLAIDVWLSWADRLLRDQAREMQDMIEQPT